MEDNQGLTTVYITGVTGPDGRIYNVPGYADGHRLTAEEAAARAAHVGWDKYPSYATGPESDRAAEKLHTVIDHDMEIFNKYVGRNQ